MVCLPIIQPIKCFPCKINSELYKGIRLDVNAMFNNKSVDGGGSYSGMKYVLRQPISGGTYFTRDQMLTEQTYVDFVELRVPIRLLTL